MEGLAERAQQLGVQLNKHRVVLQAVLAVLLVAWLLTSESSDALDLSVQPGMPPATLLPHPPAPPAAAPARHLPPPPAHLLQKQALQLRATCPLPC